MLLANRQNLYANVAGSWLREELGHKEEFGPYAILGVTPGSDWAVIKQAYIRLSQEHHPDKGGDQSQMQKITEAYTELKLIYS